MHTLNENNLKTYDFVYWIKSTYKMCANIKGYGTSVCFLALFWNFFMYSNDEDVKY